jgi:hypothetical protein
MDIHNADLSDTRDKQDAESGQIVAKLDLDC